MSGKKRSRAVGRDSSPSAGGLPKAPILVFLLALVLALGGWWLVWREASRIPVDEATIGGLRLQLVEARWLLDQMDHGENFQKPSTMMPDMPAWGDQRVTLELTVDNRADAPRTFDGAELFLVPRYGEEVGPSGANVGYADLAPGQTLHTAIHFDFDTTEPFGRLHAEWRREGETYVLPIPEPAEHYHLRPRGGEIVLPPDARLVLPLGDAERGERLYKGRYGCVGCHGDPGRSGSNNVGPHLASIGVDAGSRIEGQHGAQYIYDSILHPGDFIAPECKGGRPCQEPSAMPEYASLVTLEDIADLLAYMLDQTG